MDSKTIISIKIPNKVIIRVGNYTDFCFWFSIFDILFLPYFKWFSICFSVPFIALWLAFNRNVAFKGREGFIVKVMGIIFAASSVISLVYPFAIRMDTSVSTTVKRSIQYFIVLGYYLFYRHYFRNHKVRIDKVLYLFIIFMTGLAFLYHIFPQEYAPIKYFLYPADNHTLRFLNNEIGYRFNGLLVDPNNVAYLVNGVMGWLILRDNIGMKDKLIIMSCSIFVVLSTASMGGLLAFVLVMGFIVLSGIKRRWYMANPVSLMALVLFTVVVIIILNQDSIQEKISVNLMALLKDRSMHYKDRNDISGGRLSDFIKSLNYLNPLMLFVGSGKEGISFEIGHLYFIGMYGFLAYMGFIWLSFRKTCNQVIKDYIWILPFFIGFTLNIAIGEFKWLAIFYLLLAYSRTIGNKEMVIITSERRKVLC